MPHLIWDTEHPPEQPPAAADPLIWRLAYGLRGDHIKADADGRCAACREPAPCHLLSVALEGLVLAMARGERYALLEAVLPIGRPRPPAR
jgi:hypothetical protein